MRIEIPRYKIAPLMGQLHQGVRLAAGLPGVPLTQREEGVPFYPDGRPDDTPVAIIAAEGRFFWEIDDTYAENPPLYDRPFIHTVFDCYQFMRDYYLQELDIALPQFDYQDEWWVAGSNLYLDNATATGFKPVNPPLRPGDVILFRIMSPVANHAAIYVGEGNIAHHLGGRRSCIEPFRRALIRDVMGYYRYEAQ
jgi:cell wall-associated NlpC family hydrolase